MVLASTPILDEAARLLSQNVLRDTVHIYDRGPVKTVGINAQATLTKKTPQPVRALVQETVLSNAVESRVDVVYSIKLNRTQALEPGQVVEVVSCGRQPQLVGRRILVDKVSRNGAAVICKAVGADYLTVDQQGKAVL